MDRGHLSLYGNVMDPTYAVDAADFFPASVILQKLQKEFSVPLRMRSGSLKLLGEVYCTHAVSAYRIRADPVNCKPCPPPSKMPSPHQTRPSRRSNACKGRSGNGHVQRPAFETWVVVVSCRPWLRGPFGIDCTRTTWPSRRCWYTKRSAIQITSELLPHQSCTVRSRLRSACVGRSVRYWTSSALCGGSISLTVGSGGVKHTCTP
jgi:hypothetical protein